MVQSVALITGANSGIGAVTARELAAKGYRVFLACRSEPAAQTVIDEIKASGGQASFLKLDLGNLDSVRACADTFLATGLPLNVLVNNAGVACVKGLTASGFELAFGICHVGHALLTHLLLDRLKASAPSRIVNVASGAHMIARGINFEAVRKPTKSLTAFPEYGVAKLANILHAVELARQLEGTGVTTYSLHPGAVATSIWRFVGPLQPLFQLFMITPEQGARTTLYCATSPDVATQSGLYYERCKIQKTTKYAKDPQLAKTLCEHTSRWLGI